MLDRRDKTTATWSDAMPGLAVLLALVMCTAGCGAARLASVRPEALAGIEWVASDARGMTVMLALDVSTGADGDCMAGVNGDVRVDGGPPLQIHEQRICVAGQTGGGGRVKIGLVLPWSRVDDRLLASVLSGKPRVQARLAAASHVGRFGPRMEFDTTLRVRVPLPIVVSPAIAEALVQVVSLRPDGAGGPLGILVDLAVNNPSPASLHAKIRDATLRVGNGTFAEDGRSATRVPAHGVTTVTVAFRPLPLASLTWLLQLARGSTAPVCMTATLELEADGLSRAGALQVCRPLPLANVLTALAAGALQWLP